ncbi:dihydrofolate reductase family protein [Allosalinactinospora lopnorensis]|uniref:dihydrofolate reductase family protein n=1 Tax=Allosalinactinospora lopnorensis TaxID=1352348 RepID=UPI000623C84F|nr:dihydrofolate reductase family protein [Allosalinactinospora lopnorensis]
MAKLVVGTFLTLDGVMQAPGGPDEDRDGGFEHGGWLVPYFDDQLGQTMVDWTDRAASVLLGRRTYQIFAAHWPHVSGDDPIAAKLNSVPKYVASRTLGSVDWYNSTLLKGDAAEEVAALKQRTDGEIQVPGSCGLIQTLIRHDLVDEYRLCVFPVLLGAGKRLFGEGTLPAGLRLIGTRTSGTGVAIHVYERAGGLDYGSFALEEERTR